MKDQKQIHAFKINRFVPLSTVLICSIWTVSCSNDGGQTSLSNQIPTIESLQITNAINNIVATPQLDIEIQVKGIVHEIQIGQDRTFSQDFSPIRTFEKDSSTIRFKYDLNLRRNECINPAIHDCDGIREIFVRLIHLNHPPDAATIEQRTITLDTKPPSVSSSSLQYRPAPNNPLAQVQAATGAASPGPTTVYCADDVLRTRERSGFKFGYTVVRGFCFDIYPYPRSTKHFGTI